MHQLYNNTVKTQSVVSEAHLRLFNNYSSSPNGL